ncbi:MAG: ATP-binding protein [Longimicrobiales bacterium]
MSRPAPAQLDYFWRPSLSTWPDATAEEGALRAAVDSLPNQIAVLDGQGRIVALNRAWCAFANRQGTTIDASQYVGADYLQVCRDIMLLHVADAARVLSRLRVVIAGEQNAGVCDYVHDAPEPIWFELRVQRLEAGHGLVVSHLDVTIRKRAELQAASRLHELTHVSRAVNMGALAGSAAHELNQPLTAILSNAQAALRFLAMDEPPLAMVRDILLDITAADQRAAEIIRRVRRLLRKGEPGEREAVDVNEVVQDALHMLADEGLLRKVRTRVTHEPDLPIIKGDPVQLQQVVMNLVLNSFDAMDDVPPAERLLMVQTARGDADHIELIVQDCGAGVNETQLSGIFEPFYTTKLTGLGMGLYITRVIVESHGGRICAQHAVPRGLRMQVTLPLPPNAPR